ncbi:MAG: protein-L-isoaspartate o-methyltransferase 1 [Thermomicrobium sp.]|nr:protein-L-isoaspartate o-methyltransferase 1 [Thermomicrobium sp.]
MTLDETAARAIALEALDRLGGPRHVYGSPRHPFSPAGTRVLTVAGHAVRVRYGEIASPAVVEVAGYVFEVREDELILLFSPAGS